MNRSIISEKTTSRSDCYCLTINDVLIVDTDVVVTVVAGLLVVEAQSMEQLVLDGVVVQAAGTAQRHGLSITSTTNVGVTSGGRRSKTITGSLSQ